MITNETPELRAGISQMLAHVLQKMVDHEQDRADADRNGDSAGERMNKGAAMAYREMGWRLAEIAKQPTP